MPKRGASMPVFDDVEPMLAGLRRAGCRLAVLTNCDDDLFGVTHQHIPVFRSTWFVTAERCAATSRCRGTSARSSGHGVEPPDWVHVASSRYHDIEPARALGIQHVWLDRDRHGGAGCAGTRARAFRGGREAGGESPRRPVRSGADAGVLLSE